MLYADIHYSSQQAYVLAYNTNPLPTAFQRLLLILHESICSLSCAASATFPACQFLLIVQHVSVCCLSSVGCSSSISVPDTCRIMSHSIYRPARVALSSQLYFYCIGTSLNLIATNWIPQWNASFHCTWVVSKHDNRQHVPISGGWISHSSQLQELITSQNMY